ncbi:nuclear transport factor 2 family protein [Jiangella anatolica]|uniref:Nuclear transport factor 2 family protein n=1 Tax=Jiangella anatolica TaxID=2670374 RepID=A0A2W2BC14_9ACTN|nr:nuclear transport factor 2 family protein [Jiangella anatolica]PZF82830.1 nuclear transport factor 2 family protein [Jiangella anatolica]
MTPPVDVALAFIEAFARRDLDLAATFVADDVTFESPRVSLSGAPAYLAAVGEFAQLVDGVQVIAAVGDATQALVMYDMATEPFGTIRAADRYVVAGGRITANQLVFDTSRLHT